MATSCWFDPGQGHQPSLQVQLRLASQVFRLSCSRLLHSPSGETARLRCTKISDFDFQTAGGAVLANAPPPPFSGAGRAFNRAPRCEGAKRRQALVRNAAPRGPPCGRACPSSGRDRRPMTRTGTPLGASPRRFWASGPCFRDSDGWLFASPIAELSPRSSCPVQPWNGRLPVVGADGDPRPPGSPADEAGRAGAAPRSANQRHRLTPSTRRLCPS